jgi:hypothetical protein
MSQSSVSIAYQGSIAIIKINALQKLNPLTEDEFYELATLLSESVARPGIIVTILIGTGRFFSAYVLPIYFIEPAISHIPLLAGQMFQKTAIPHPEPIPPRSPPNSRQQPQPDGRVFHAFQDPRDGVERPCDWHVSSNHRVLALDFRCAEYTFAYAFFRVWAFVSEGGSSHVYSTNGSCEGGGGFVRD